MNVAVAMTVLAGVALLWIWAPAYPTPERHEHMRALDELERLYAEPDRYCPACGTWLPGDALFCGAECQTLWLEDA